MSSSHHQEEEGESPSYYLRVTAGPSYDSSTHVLVPVNSSSSDAATRIESSHIQAQVRVRIKEYDHGLPRRSPRTSAYFEHAKHAHDLYSIEFSFVLPESSIPGDELLFGNDFDQPIRDSLPTGFGAALRLVRWSIDPGLDGDVYADKPYLYGPLLSSINVLNIGNRHGSASGAEASSQESKDTKHADEGDDVDDVLEEDTTHAEQHQGIPHESAARMKHFLAADKRKHFAFEQGRSYTCDFFNPYLDFNQFALRLPGITLHLMRFWDGQPLRYVLKHRSDTVDRELLVVLFALVPADQIDEEERKWKDKTAPAAVASSSPSPSSRGQRGEESAATTTTTTADDDVD